MIYKKSIISFVEAIFRTLECLGIQAANSHQTDNCNKYSVQNNMATPLDMA